LSAWLEEQANDLPPLEETLQPVECKKIPVLEVDELWSFVYQIWTVSTVIASLQVS